MIDLDARGYADFDGHERVVLHRDPATGLHAIIAIHDRSLGPALGGCRMWPYEGETAAITDVLRLSRGMSYKSALAGLDLGGGKAVIIGDPRRDKTRDLMLAMGEFIDRLEGAYITAEDSGTRAGDMSVIAKRTAYVSGLAGADGGDPSPSTAYGVFLGLRTALAHRFGSTQLDGVRVALQGLGSVGFELARRLHAAGARLVVSDLDEARLRRAREELEAEVLPPGAILAAEADVFSPCALGAVLDWPTIAELRAPVVAGAANNQLADASCAVALKTRGVLYAPDFVVNAGGIVDIYWQYGKRDRASLQAKLEEVVPTLSRVFERADASGLSTHEAAEQMAGERLANGQHREAPACLPGP